MDKKYHVMTVTKTHWDREWYMDYQKTRYKLIHLIDTVLDLIDDDPEFNSFMLDGQTLPLEDYLEVKPQNRDRLERAISDNRLIIGPWYILPDEVLITGEAHIRNYLLGSRLARKFGAKKMQIGYLPDSFGHPSQMPQIIRKLGMDSIMFWRGATKDIEKNEFRWYSPDGSSVLAVLMPEGYSTGCELSEDPELVARRFDEYISKMSHRSMCDVLYLSNGGDHLEPSPYLTKLLKDANRLMNNGTVTHTTLENYFMALNQQLDHSKLKNFEGELWGSNTATLLGSTMSTRVYLKQLNHKASSLLEIYLEPLFTMAAANGCEYPRDMLVRAWKYLMENQPHDSICGCSIDRVHRDMLARYDQVFAIGDAMTDTVKEYFSGLDASNVSAPYAAGVFNTFAVKRSDIVEVTVDVDARLTAKSDYGAFDKNGRFPVRIINDVVDAMKPVPTSVRVFDAGKEIPCKLIGASAQNKLVLGCDHFPHQYNVNRLKIEFLAENVPATGVKLYGVEPVYGEIPEEEIHIADSIRNEYYIVASENDGSITLTDIKAAKTIKGLNRLVDGGDCGDEYTYCPPDVDKLVGVDETSVRCRVVEKNSYRQVMKIDGVMNLPKGVSNISLHRSEETVVCPFSSVITLYSGIKRIDIKTTVDNRARDHRLRALFPVGCKSAMSRSAGTFSVDERPVEAVIPSDCMEICHTHPQKDFCDAGDGQYGVTVANRGLCEYEAFNEGNETVLAVTLLRCVGVISRLHMKTRYVKGGWSEKTEDAQCIGSWSFDYSIIPHEGTWEKSESYAEAHSFNFPMLALQLEPNGLNSVAADSLVSVEGNELIISALKQCEFEDEYILRVYNSTSETVSRRVRFSDRVKKVSYANLREDTLWDAGMKEQTVSLEVKPYEIVTFKMDI